MKVSIRNCKKAYWFIREKFNNTYIKLLTNKARRAEAKKVIKEEHGK